VEGCSGESTRGAAHGPIPLLASHVTVKGFPK
jgi:hypothetical protein